MRKAQTDARSLGRNFHWSSHPILKGTLFRSLASAYNSLAIALRHINPGLRIAVDFRSSAARHTAGRGTVVLAGFGDAVAFFGFEGWGRRGFLCRQNRRRDR